MTATQVVLLVVPVLIIQLGSALIVVALGGAVVALGRRDL